MHTLKFAKMVASGNDFVVLSGGPQLKGKNLRSLAIKLCDCKYGAGADGMLLLERSRKADLRMRIFNADGSEAQMCGNGSRCAVLYAARLSPALHCPPKGSMETRAGKILYELKKDSIKVRLTEPKNMQLDVPVKIDGRTLRVNFINTGVPHAVIFVQGLDRIGVFNLGRQIRYHSKFSPAGTNVDFVEIFSRDAIAVRTYERGVEDETLACGTGSVASALITAAKSGLEGINKINVRTKGGEVLKIYFNRTPRGFNGVCLEGKAELVYKGEYYV